MNFSGTIDETSGMTMTRLIERIVHSDTPGELRLHDEASGRRASIAIRRGMVQEVNFGGMTGNPALTAISQVMPWTFEFAGDEPGAVPAHPAMVSRRPRARTVARSAPRPDSPEQPLDFSASDPSPAANEAISQVPQEPAISASNHIPEELRAWITEPGSPHCIRFGSIGEEFAGEVDPDDYEYFRGDYQFLRVTAAGIARSLGCPEPHIMAIAEPERATGYATVPGGFLGIIGGAGAGVNLVTDFPLAAGQES